MSSASTAEMIADTIALGRTFEFKEYRESFEARNLVRERRSPVLCGAGYHRLFTGNLLDRAFDVTLQQPG
jgi:hypothetical protein